MNKNKEYLVILGKPIITFSRKDRAKQYIKTGKKLTTKGQHLYLIKKEDNRLSLIET